MDLNEKLIEIREKLYNMSISEFEEMLERNGANRYMSSEINGRTDINAPFRPKVLATEEEILKAKLTKSYLDIFKIDKFKNEDIFHSYISDAIKMETINTLKQLEYKLSRGHYGDIEILEEDDGRYSIALQEILKVICQ